MAANKRHNREPRQRETRVAGCACCSLYVFVCLCLNLYHPLLFSSSSSFFSFFCTTPTPPIIIFLSLLSLSLSFRWVSAYDRRRRWLRAPPAAPARHAPWRPRCTPCPSIKYEEEVKREAHREKPAPVQMTARSGHPNHFDQRILCAKAGCRGPSARGPAVAGAGRAGPVRGQHGPQARHDRAFTSRCSAHVFPDHDEVILRTPRHRCRAPCSLPRARC